MLRLLEHPNVIKLRDVIVPPDLRNFNEVYLVFECLPTDMGKLLSGPHFLGPEHIRWLLFDLLKVVPFNAGNPTTDFFAC